MKPRRLEILREKMKDKDKEIVRLLNERAQISVQIGKVKGEGGIQVYDPSQEAKVHGYLQELNSGPLPPKALIDDFPGNYFRFARSAKTDDHRFSGAGSFIFPSGGASAFRRVQPVFPANRNFACF